MVWLAMPASAQFGKLLKDVEKGIKDVKKKRPAMLLVPPKTRKKA